MPAIKYYEVEETRVVKVRANNAADAARIAAYAFEHGQNSDTGILVTETTDMDNHPLNGVWGNTSSRIETTSLHVSKEF